MLGNLLVLTRHDRYLGDNLDSYIIWNLSRWLHSRLFQIVSLLYGFGMYVYLSYVYQYV